MSKIHEYLGWFLFGSYFQRGNAERSFVYKETRPNVLDLLDVTYIFHERMQ